MIAEILAFSLLISPLWRDLHAGMTVEEAVQAEPAAQPATGSPLNDGRLGLRVDDVRIADQIWTAGIYFGDTGRLSVVRIVPASSVDPFAYAPMFARVQRDLSSKYGPPTNCERPDVAEDQRRCDWSTANSRISLSYFGDGPLLILAYRPLLAQPDL